MENTEVKTIQAKMDELTKVKSEKAKLMNQLDDEIQAISKEISDLSVKAVNILQGGGA